MPFSPDDIFSQLASFAEREAHAHQADHQERYSLPVEARVAAGAAISGLYYKARESRNDLGDCFTFVAERNDSRLRPGSRLRLSRGDPRHPSAKVELLHDHFDGEQFVFQLAILSRESQEPLDGPEPWVLDEDQFDLLDIEMHMLREAQKGGLGAWLSGDEPVDGSEVGQTMSLMGENLQGSLRQAFETAVSAKNWFSIQGPPGSGKTHLLARLALHAALEKGQRVLVTAVSHQAIHKALAECYWMAAQLKIDHPLLKRLLESGFYKLGSSKANSAGLPAGVRPARQVNKLPGPLIAGSTMYAVFNSIDKAKLPLYDLVLFDEAGQAPLSLALGSRLVGSKVVFIGDDQQLPPVTQSIPETEAERWLSRSALHLIRHQYGDPFLLLETRRLNSEICRAISDCFYEGKLSPIPQAADNLLPIRRTPREPFQEILNPDRSLIFLDVPHQNARAFSEQEARWTANIALEAIRCGVAPADIGVMSPYRAQCNRIRFLLKHPDILVATAERFQGQEREMVILSLASSHTAYLAQLHRFLFSSNRLNVAISRARTKAVMIGSKRILEKFAAAADPDIEEARGCRDFLKLLSHFYIVSPDSSNGSPAAEIKDTLVAADRPDDSAVEDP